MDPVLPRAFSGCLSLLALGALLTACNDGSALGGTEAVGGPSEELGTGGQPVSTGTGGFATGVGGTLPSSGGAVVTPSRPSLVGTAILIQPDSEVDDPAHIGFAFGTRNAWGINGPAYTFHDDTGSTIEGYVPEPRSVCTYGTVAEVNPECGVLPSCWSVYWGAGWGLNVNQVRHPGPDDVAEPQPLDLSGVDTLAFEIAGPDVPPFLWVMARVDGDDTYYCAPVYAGQNYISLASLRRNCWDNSESTYVDRSKILSLQFNVATTTVAPISYDYCVNDLEALHETLLLK